MGNPINFSETPEYFETGYEHLPDVVILSTVNAATTTFVDVPDIVAEALRRGFEQDRVGVWRSASNQENN